MRIRFVTGFLMLLLGGALINFLPASDLVGAFQAADNVRIYGLVNKPLNLTRAELLSFPMVSEVARLECVMGTPNVIYNWTGIPLFYLLTLTRIRPEAYKVVTRSSDGFESDLLVAEALLPSTILALGANGTDLPDINGVQGSFRLVVPCKWGYKWVGDVKEIEVVDTDYKGTYESSGWSDAGDMPDCGPLPAIIPPLETFHLLFGNRTFDVAVFTNVSLTVFAFDYLQKEIEANLTVPMESTGSAVFILSQDFLIGPFNVTLDEKEIPSIEASVTRRSFIHLSAGQGNHTASIFGTVFLGHVPEITVDYNNTANVGQTIIFNASKSADYGEIIAFEWSFGDGMTGTGSVVSHSYNDTGVFEVTLNVTNNQGISNLATLPVTVQSPSLVMPLSVKLFLAAIAGLLVVMFVDLLRKRKPTTEVHSAAVEKTATAEPTHEKHG